MVHSQISRERWLLSWGTGDHRAWELHEVCESMVAQCMGKETCDSFGQWQWAKAKRRSRLKPSAQRQVRQLGRRRWAPEATRYKIHKVVDFLCRLPSCFVFCGDGSVCDSSDVLLTWCVPPDPVCP